MASASLFPRSVRRRGGAEPGFGPGVVIAMAGSESANMRQEAKIKAKSALCTLAALGLGGVLAAGGAQAQTAEAVAWRADGLGISDKPSLLPQFIQQDLGRGAWDRDAGSRGWRMNRPEEGESGRDGAQEAPDRMRPDLMRPHGMGPGMMAMGGARFHMRKGDAEIDVHCPADVRMSDCVEAIGKMIDRLGPPGSGAPR